MKVSVSIMAHPDRAEMVDQLRERLEQPARVAFDLEGPPTRHPDRIWRTARRAWERFEDDADWHLLLQDDAVIADHLMEMLPAALSRVPQRSIVSLYVGGGRPLSSMWEKTTAEANQVGASWIVGPRALWGVALALPVPLIGDMLAYCDRQHGATDDMRVGRWGQRSKLETWFTWPCLVDHPDGGSLVGHGGGRTARSFQADARGSDWSGPVVRWKRA